MSVAPRFAKLVVQVLRRAPLYVAAATAGLTCRAAALKLRAHVGVKLSKRLIHKRNAIGPLQEHLLHCAD